MIMREEYKKTDFGKIPVEWNLVKLNTIFNRITTKNKECNKNVLTISAQKGLINQEEFFNKSVASKENSNYYLLEKDDFAYNKSYSNGYPMGAIKKLEYYDKGIVSPLYICFRLVDKNSDKEFYKYFFEYNIFEKAISSIAQEGARNHGLLNVSVSDFFDLPIFKPPLKEQQKISLILSSVDEQIEITNSLIEKINELKKGLMQRLLTKGIGHDRFKNTEIGKIPEEWEVKSFKEVISVLTDYHSNGSYKILRENVELLDNEDYAIMVRITNLSKNATKEFKYINKKAYDFLQKSKLLPNDIVMSKISDAGSVYIVPDFSKPMSLAMNLFLIRTINNVFYYYYLSFKEKYVKSFASGTATTTITKEDVRNILVPYFNKEEQDKIAKILLLIDEQIEQYQSKKDKLQELKKGLMQELLTGKIRV